MFFTFFIGIIMSQEAEVMNNLGIVRLERIKFQNIKNVKNGEIYFPEQKKLERGEFDIDEFGSVLGIYGQNGSGKTTTVDALRILQNSLCGTPLFSFNPNYVTAGETSSTIEADFLIDARDNLFFVNYLLELGTNDRISTFVKREKISFYSRKEPRKNNYYLYSDPGSINNVFAASLNDKEKAIYSFTVGIETKSNINTQAPLSSVFNRKTIDIISKAKGVNDDFKIICMSLSAFAAYKFAIYSLSYFNDNQNVGIRFRLRQSTSEITNISDIFVPFSPTLLTIDQFNSFKKIVNQINKVIPSLIPNYKLDFHILNSEIEQEYSKSIQFVLVSKRGDETPIPLSLESNGIKKILSILSGFIDAFNHEGCLIVIDELDSGIFEYLLGEMVYAFANFAKGQLIFNSHNMRILEKVDYKNFFFTTTDRNDAFVQINKVRESNNLRDMYYKYLVNFEESGKKLYDAVRTEEMINALYIED